MPRTAAHRLTAALLAAGLVLSGCSSDSEGAEKATTTTAATDAAPAEGAALAEALSVFQPYVEQQAGTVATDVKRFTDAVRAGDVELAKEL